MKTLTAAIPTNLKLVLLAFYAAGMLPCAKADPREKARPNIILTVADDMGWAAPSCYGHPFSNTVNIDAMAANGVRFTRFYASFPQCTPTRASILTGRDPGRTHCIGAGSTMPTEERTLAEILKNEGYVTAHIGKWHLGVMLCGDASNGNFDFDGEHGELSDGKGGLGEGGIRVSSIVEYPKHFKPVVIDSLSSTVDITPTLCDVLSIPLPDDRVYDGESLIPQMTGGKSTRRKPLFYAFRHPDGKPYALSLIDGDWKLIWGIPRMEDRSQHSLDAASALSLYDLKGDPAEKTNLAGVPTSAQRITAMKQALLQMDRSVQKDYKAHADRWDSSRELD